MSHEATSFEERWLSPKGLLKVSVVVAFVTIALKTLAWWLTSSVGLLSDAMESLVNLASAMFGLMMVTVAQTPADDDHPYGHHKAEYFSSGFEGILIMVAALGIVWMAVDRLLQPKPLETIGLGLVLSVVSSGLNGWLAWVMMRVAKAQHSIALMADSKHLMADVWTASAVVVGLMLAVATHLIWIDSLVAMGVALVILKEGFALLWESSQGLMDEALEPESRELIQAVLEDFAHQDVIRFDHVVTRKSGQRCYVELHMHMPASWSLGRAAAVRFNVEQALMGAVPGLRATIELLPSNMESHFESHAEADPH